MISTRSLAGLLLLSVPALAQQPAKQSAPQQQAQSSQPSQPSHATLEWQSSPMTDSHRGTKAIQFTLAGKFIKRPGQGSPEHPTLVVNCNPAGFPRGGGRKFMNASVQVGLPLKIDYVEPSQLTTGTSYYPKVAVHYGLDDGKSEKEQWSAGADKTSATFPNAALKRILNSHTVVIALESDAESEISVQFDLPDSSQVAQACGINLRKK